MPTNSNRIPTIAEQFRPDEFSWNSVEPRLSNFDYFRPFPNNAGGNVDGNVGDNTDENADKFLMVVTISDRFRPSPTQSLDRLNSWKWETYFLKLDFWCLVCV